MTKYDWATSNETTTKIQLTSMPSSKSTPFQNTSNTLYTQIHFMFLDSPPGVKWVSGTQTWKTQTLFSVLCSCESVYKMTILFNSPWRNYLLASGLFPTELDLRHRNTHSFFNRENVYRTHSTKLKIIPSSSFIYVQQILPHFFFAEPRTKLPHLCGASPSGFPSLTTC